MANIDGPFDTVNKSDVKVQIRVKHFGHAIIVAISAVQINSSTMRFPKICLMLF